MTSQGYSKHVNRKYSFFYPFLSPTCIVPTCIRNYISCWGYRNIQHRHVPCPHWAYMSFQINKKQSGNQRGRRAIRKRNRENFSIQITFINPCLKQNATKQGLVCPRWRKPNSDSGCLQQSKGLFAGCQARRTGNSCSKDPNSPMAFRQGFLKTVIGERVVGCVTSSWTLFWLVGNSVMFPESRSSTFWFQPVWGLRACDQHVVTILHLDGGLSFSRTTQSMHQIVIYIPLGQTRTSCDYFSSH